MSEQIEITAKLETADLAEAWAKLKDAKPKLCLDIRLGARTDLGMARENNEDNYEFFMPEEPEILAVKGSLFAVADGMGGHASGQIASGLALKHIVGGYYADPSDDVEASLASAFRAANSYIYDSAQAIISRQGMGTTCTSIVLRDDDLFLAHVGDSRLYRIRRGAIAQLSQDHSWVAEQVRAGLLTEEEAAVSPFRNVITRSMGTYPSVEPDVSREQVEKDDVYLLCSDGLSGTVPNETLLEIAGNHSPAVAAKMLVDCANDHGGGDNITVVIVAVRDIRKPGASNGYWQRVFGKA